MKTKTPTQKILILRSSLALALTLAICTPILAQTAVPEAPTETQKGKMMKDHQDMMQARNEMMEEMKAQDAELTADIAKMNSAPEDKKVDLIAGILTRMVEQRAARDAQMEKMHGMMMPHMQMDRKSKDHHPMMNGMSDSHGMDNESGE